VTRAARRLLALAAGLALAAPLAAAAAASAAADAGAPGLAPAAFEPLRGVGAHRRGEGRAGAWLRFESAGPGATAAVGTPRPLAASLDLRGRFVSLRVRVDRVERLAGAELVLASRAGAFVIPVPVFADPPMNLLQSGAWLDLTLSLGAARREGRPDRGAIERVEWRLAERADAGPPLTGWVGALATHALPAEGVVSFGFDDGYDEHFGVAAPLLAEHGFRATAYVMPEQVGTPGYLSREQVHALARNFGWEVGAHHFEPFTGFPPEALPGVLDGIQAWLEANGAGEGRRQLAYPLGKHDAGILALVRARFSTARLASGGAETLPPADPLRLRAYNVLSTTTPAQLGEAARRAREEREWLILMFHWLVDAPQRETEYPIASLREALGAIAASGVAVRPVGEVWRSFGSAPAGATSGAPTAAPAATPGAGPR
jgi:peptidoglycan/xylan/chitin deacetylase (PgdA/CDA1 family)